MSNPQKSRPSGGGSGDALNLDLPVNSSQVAARLQRRLSAYALAQDSICRDLNRVDELLAILHAGFGLTDGERHEIAEMRVRMFDCREILA